MKRIGQIRKQYDERSDLFILILTGIHNLIFADVSLAGMPLRTLSLLLADFVCIAVYICQREMILPRWKECSVYEKTMTVLLVSSAAVIIVSALAGSDYFWEGMDFVALLLVYLCIYGRKKFPQNIFCVHSVCCCVTCSLLLCYYLTGGVGESLVALLVRNDAAVSWLVLSVLMNMIAYCFEEKGRVWYGGNILLAAFLLAIQKNVYGMIVVGLIPLLLPVFCRPSKALVGRAAQAELLYVFLVCNMSLIAGYTPLLEGIVTYDLEVSVYMELFLAAMGVWFFSCWDKQARDVGMDVTLPQMREWCRKAAVAYLTAVAGVFAASALFYTDDTSAWRGVAQVIIDDLRENPGWRAGLLGQMGQRFGVFGVAAGCGLCYLCIVRIYGTRRWSVKAHKLYRLIAVICLLQAVFVPQSMVSLPLSTVFFFLFMEAEEEQSRKITADYGEWRKTNETDYTDSLFQRGGDFGNRVE